MSNENDIKPKASPKDVFMHLLMIAMLYVGTFMFCLLWFNYINFIFPDTLNYYYQGIADEILQATSTLIVVFPVFILLSWLLGKEMVALPEKRELSVRKWLVYLTLFFAAIAIIVEVVRLVYNFLSGDLTMPFFLKIFVVLVVAFVVFGYYLWDVRRKAGDASQLPKRLAWGVSAVILGSIAYGFILIGSPAHQRDLRFDDRRISDLQNIQSQTITYWQQKETLPSKLSDLTDNVSGFTPPTDPDTHASYEYSVKGPLAFELCATFGTKSISNGAPGQTPAFGDNWTHDPGRVCFERTIDPALYKINKPMPVIIQNQPATVPAAVPVK
jgi:hypothetical protein